MKRLNQHLATESQIKSETDAGTTTLHRVTQKPDLFLGFEKTYEPLEEGGTMLPQESKKVQFIAENVVKDSAQLWVRLFDFTIAKDAANANAKADVVLDEVIVLKEVPVTTLLFLEKQLEYVKKFVDTIPVLDPADNWEYDKATGYYKSGEVRTHRTKKVQKSLVLYPHSDKHPAQTQMVTEDVLEGYWKQVKFSGALPAPRKQKILERIALLQKAVKIAREGANGSTEVEKISIGDSIFNYLLME